MQMKKALLNTNIEATLFNIASGKPVSIRSMIEIICTLTGSGNPQYGELPYRPGENMELYANIDRAKNILRWEPTTTLEIGLKQTIDWFVINKIQLM